MDVKERQEGQDLWGWLELHVRAQMSRGWYPLLFVTSSSTRPRQLLVYESDGVRGSLLRPSGAGMPSEEEILRALRSSLERRVQAGETFIAAVCYPHQAENEEKVIGDAETLDAMGLTAAQVSRVVCDAYVRKSMLASCPSGDLARVEAALDANARRDTIQRGVAGVLLMWENDVERVPVEGREAEVEWWPERLAPIESEFTGLLARDYAPIALLAQPRGRAAIVPVVVDSEILKRPRVWNRDQLVRRWDAMIGEAEDQGHTMAALVCVGFGGDVLVVPYLGYADLAERGIGPDELERATLEAVQKLQGALGVSCWPIAKVSLV